MSDAFITRRGGGGGLSTLGAVLHVNAPVGSTITLAKGGVTVKVLDAAKGHTSAEVDSLADWYYSVSPSNYGEWTVTASDGTNTASASVTIDSNKQYDVELTYDLYLLKNGLFQFAHSIYDVNETQYNGYMRYKATYTNGRIWVPLTAEMLGAGTYTNLVFNFKSIPRNQGIVTIIGLSSGTDYATWVARVNDLPSSSTEAVTRTVDISSYILSGKYVKINAGSTDNEFTVTDIFLAR